MMKTISAVAVSLALAASAFAQPGPGLMGRGPMMGGERGMMMGGCAMGSHVEGMLAFLKTELKITAAQETTWNAFAAAYRDVKAAPMMSDDMGPGGMGPGGMMGPGGKGSKAQPLPERMAQHEQMMEARLATMKKMHAAMTPLYNALSTEQKRTADEVMPMGMMCRMM